MAERARVLVVDDAALVRRYYREVLEAAGYEVEEALNGLEALEHLLRQSADLLIVDINMPQMDGLSFLRQLRQRPAPLGGIPAIVASSEAGEHDRQAASSAGANFYLIKPIKREMLIEYADLFCGRRHG
jgi:two-component system chemotaxis response regulator CheY